MNRGMSCAGIRSLAAVRPMRQFILKEAFASRLVPQYPNDEPASELLARIHAERETDETKFRDKSAKKPA